MNIKKMKLLQGLEDLLAESGCFSILFSPFSFHYKHRVKVLEIGAKWRKRKTKQERKEREKGKTGM